MFKKVMLVIAIAFVAVGFSPLVMADQHDGNTDRVRICHRTNSAANPYNSIEVNHSAVDGTANGNNDHSGHTGPVFDPLEHNQQNRGWGDIIPPVEGVTAGLNWTAAGVAIWENDCQLPETSVIPTTVEVCVLDNKEVVEIDEADFDAALHSMDLDDCGEVLGDRDDEEEDGQILGETTQVVAPTGAVAAGAGSVALTSLAGLVGTTMLMGLGLSSIFKSDK